MSVLENVSADQDRVLDLLDNNYNVTVKANPGSGKTRLILQIASAFPEKNLLVLSFNNELVRSTKLKLEEFETSRAGWTSVQTYHGLMGTLASRTVSDDILFGEMLRTVDFAELRTSWPHRDFDLLVIDEAQDLKERFVLLILMLVAVIATKPTQLVFLYDERQTLYSFYPINNADARYAALAPRIYGPYLERCDWEHVVLPVSYRLSPQSVALLNALVPGCNMVSSTVQPVLHNYITLYLADVYRDSASIVLDIIHREAGIAKHYGSILILVNSIHSPHSPARAVVDTLVSNGIPVHIPRGSNRVATSINNTQAIGDVRKNKVCVMTDCGSKGQEFSCVIKISETWLLEEQFMTNARIVALSRQRDRLYIIQHARHTTQQQIDDLLSQPTITQQTLRVIVKRQVPTEVPEKKTTTIVDTPTFVSCETLFAFLDVEYIEALMQEIDVEVIGAEQFIASTSEESDDVPERFVDVDDTMQYIAANVIEHKESNVYLDVLHITNKALLIALEYYLSRRTPKHILTIHERTRCNDTSMQYKIMASKLEGPLYEMHDLYNDDKDLFFNNIQSAPPLFAALALVSDAFSNYRDLLYQLDDFAFANTDDFKFRLGNLRMIVESLVQSHSTITGRPVKLKWDTQCSGHFYFQESPLELLCTIPLCSDDYSLIVLFSHDGEITNEERLQAVAATMAVNNTLTQDDMFPNVFVISVVSLAVEKLSLCDNVAQPVVTSTIVSAYDQTNKIATRHTPCSFLEDSFTYKFWNDAQENITKKRKSDDDFVADIHKKFKHYYSTQIETNSTEDLQ